MHTNEICYISFWIAKGEICVDFRFCPICGIYLEKDLYNTNSSPQCPLGHFQVHPNLASISTNYLVRSQRKSQAIYQSSNQSIAEG